MTFKTSGCKFALFMTAALTLALMAGCGSSGDGSGDNNNGNQQVSVTITPPSATVAPGGAQQFSATVANAPSNAVTWNVQEGAAGGTINQQGLYTAPATPGTYHVVAISQVFSNKVGTATVTVQ